MSKDKPEDECSECGKKIDYFEGWDSVIMKNKSRNKETEKHRTRVNYFFLARNFFLNIRPFFIILNLLLFFITEMTFLFLSIKWSKFLVEPIFFTPFGLLFTKVIFDFDLLYLNNYRCFP